jgi:hypothetical protein
MRVFSHVSAAGSSESYSHHALGSFVSLYMCVGDHRTDRGTGANLALLVIMSVNERIAYFALSYVSRHTSCVITHRNPTSA